MVRYKWATTQKSIYIDAAQIISGFCKETERLQKSKKDLWNKAFANADSIHAF